MLLGVAVAQATPEVDARVLRALGSVAQTLAKAGLGNDCRELLDVLTRLGYADKDLDKLRASTEKALAKVRKPKAASPAAARQLKKQVKAMAGALPAQTDNARQQLARLLLRLDGDCEPARAELGFRKVAGAWRTEADERMAKRAIELQDALRQARRLPIELEVGTSAEPLLAATFDGPRSFVRFGDLEVHSSWSEEHLRRIMTETLRAVALSRWLTNGKLEVPKSYWPQKWIIVHSVVDYEKAVDRAQQTRRLDDEVKAAKQQSSCFLQGNWILDWNRTEADTQASLISRLIRDLSTPCLSAGHKNWICQVFFGTQLPGYTWDEQVGGRGPRGTAASRKEDEERQLFRRMAEAGLLGSRSWMAWLAAREEDPAWRDSFHDEFGKVTGDGLCKATIVMDFLHERGVLPAGMVSGGPDDLGANSQAEYLEKVLKQRLPEFERDWRGWLLRDRPALCQRLSSPPKDRISKAEKQAVAYLASLRERAFAKTEAGEPVALRADPSLSEGASLHAEYLLLNREQLSSWPEAHEEFPDCEGYSPKGSWGGLHSVIAPGVGGPKEAIDGWMGTFYHRLPLLETGLMRIGWGLADDVGVLDASSLCAPRAHRSLVVWPYDGMKNVPTRFQPELPSPVPGEDQSTWGYPVTVQLGPRGAAGKKDRAVRVEVTLHAGSARGAAVDCHVSTPEDPSNPELSPKGVWCLIPKQPLKPGAAYTIVVKLPEEGETVTAKFKT